MKRLRKPQYGPDLVNVTADKNTEKFIYTLEQQDFTDYFDSKTNSREEKFLILSKMWDLKNYEMFDWDNIYDSQLIDGIVYVVDGAGSSVVIRDEEYSAEELLQVFEPHDLQEFITPGDDNVISKYFTEYEVKWESGDIEDIATQLMNDGVSFSQVVKSAEDCGLLSTD